MRASASANHVAANLNANRSQHQLGNGSSGHPRGGFPRRGALQHIACVGQIILQSAGQVGVPRPRRSHRLMQRRVASLDRQLLFPILPVAIDNLDGDRRANRLAVAHPAQHMSLVGLNLHAAAAPIALLATPQLAIHKIQTDRHASRHSRDQRHQRLSVRLSGG